MVLNQLLEEVVDEKTFLVFVKALIEDRIDEVEKEKIHPSSPYGPGCNGWENGSIEGYLEAAVAWAEDSKWGVKGGRPDQNFWKKIANFLYAGKSYE